MNEETMKAADKAATTIQANFRGYRVRKQLRTASKQNGPRRSSNSSANVNNGRSEAPATETNPPPQPPKSKRNSDGGQDTAATKIQAGIRGYLVRKRKQLENQAATKIQAGFRAFRERQTDSKKQVRAGK